MVVLPAPSRPRISIRTSLLPQSRWRTLLKRLPISPDFALFVERVLSYVAWRKSQNLSESQAHDEGTR